MRRAPTFFCNAVCLFAAALTPALAGAQFSVSSGLTRGPISVASGQAVAQSTVIARHVPLLVSSGRASLNGRLDTTKKLQLTFSLPLRNQADLDQLLASQYDPQSPEY